MKTPNRQTGFSIIELLVAMSLFMVVTTITGASVATMVSVDRTSKQTEILTTTLELILEDISREARTGTNYFCGRDSGSGGEGATADCVLGQNRRAFTFTTQENERVTFEYDPISDDITKEVNNNTPIQLNPPQVKIEDFTVVVAGSSESDDIQPQVTISIKGSTVVKGQTFTRTLQTTVVQRAFDREI